MLVLNKDQVVGVKVGGTCILRSSCYCLSFHRTHLSVCVSHSTILIFFYDIINKKPCLLDMILMLFVYFSGLE